MAYFTLWHRTRDAVLVPFTVLTGACLGPSWHSHAITPEAIAQDQDQETIRLTLRNGLLLLAHYPKLVSDSLVWVGRRDGAPLGPRDSVVRFAIPLDQIARVERFDQTPDQKQATAGAGLAAVALLGLLAIGLASWAHSWDK